jgi:hypothetical protein
MYGVSLADVQEWCIPVIRVVMTMQNMYLSVVIEKGAKEQRIDSKSIPMTRSSFQV